MKKVPMLVSLAVVLAMALIQWRVSWPPAEWEQSNIMSHAARLAVSCPVQACHVLVHNLISR